MKGVGGSGQDSREGMGGGGGDRDRDDQGELERWEGGDSEEGGQGREKEKEREGEYHLLSFNDYSTYVHFLQDRVEYKRFVREMQRADFAPVSSVLIIIIVIVYRILIEFYNFV